MAWAYPDRYDSIDPCSLASSFAARPTCFSKASFESDGGGENVRVNSLVSPLAMDSPNKLREQRVEVSGNGAPRLGAQRDTDSTKLTVS